MLGIDHRDRRPCLCIFSMATKAVAFLVLLLLFFIQRTAVLPQENADSLKFEIAIDKNQFLLLEPIVVSMDLSNLGSEPVHIIPNLNPGSGIVELEIEDSTHNKSIYYPVVHYYDIYSADYEGLVLQKGESYHEKFNFVFTGRKGTQGYTFPPGSYVIRAKYDPRLPENSTSLVRNIAVISNPVIFRVIKPEGRDEQVRSLVEGLKSFIAIEEPNNVYPVPREEEKSLLEDMIDSFPTSTYAKYAQYYLASYYWSRDDKKALIEFRKVIDNHLPFCYTENAEIAIAIAHYKLGEYKDAERKLEEVVKKYPGSVRIRQAILALGECYIKLGESAKARDVLNKALGRYRDEYNQKKIKEILLKLK